MIALITSDPSRHATQNLMVHLLLFPSPGFRNNRGRRHPLQWDVVHIAPSVPRASPPRPDWKGDPASWGRISLSRLVDGPKFRGWSDWSPLHNHPDAHPIRMGCHPRNGVYKKDRRNRGKDEGRSMRGTRTTDGMDTAAWWDPQDAESDLSKAGCTCGTGKPYGLSEDGTNKLATD